MWWHKPTGVFIVFLWPAQLPSARQPNPIAAPRQTRITRFKKLHKEPLKGSQS